MLAAGERRTTGAGRTELQAIPAKFLIAPIAWILAGQTGPGHATFGIIQPSLIGTVIGGTGLFAMLAHTQMRQES